MTRHNPCKRAGMAAIVSSSKAARRADLMLDRLAAELLSPYDPFDRALPKVRAYLALPDGERWARRGELTARELDLARRVWDDDHASRETEENWWG